LADFYSLLLEIVCDHSFSVGADGTLHPPPVGINPLLTHSKSEQFKRSLKRHVEDALLPSNAADVGSASTRLGGCDTVVYPLVQMGQIGFRQDEIVTERLFASFEAGSTAFLASGYFNIPQTYTDILMSSLNNWNILAASPKANGFYGAKGVAGHVPSMYVYFASQFLKKTFESSKQNNIKYFEYYRPNWTFHGKGLWFYPKSSPLPLVSLVGSSNFGCRSLLHDLETQALIVTENTSLRRALHEECRRLFECSSCVSYEQAMDREIHWLEKMATILLANRV
jgi:CDP-diacylglycerol--glycerol-3-phosphate 3-phosphatidyltransferase